MCLRGELHTPSEDLQVSANIEEEMRISFFALPMKPYSPKPLRQISQSVLGNVLQESPPGGVVGEIRHRSKDRHSTSLVCLYSLLAAVPFLPLVALH